MPSRKFINKKGSVPLSPLNNSTAPKSVAVSPPDTQQVKLFIKKILNSCFINIQ